MYLVRRVWAVQPGEARRAASLVAAVGRVYEQANQRHNIRTYFNGGSLPGQRGRVYMDWSTETIDSPYRATNEIPSEARELGAKLRELQTDTWIEFFELLTPAKEVEPDS